VAFVVKEDETLDPMNVSLLRSIAVVPGSDRLADLIEDKSPFKSSIVQSSRRKSAHEFEVFNSVEP
jgi:hypothetical protein